MPSETCLAAYSFGHYTEGNHLTLTTVHPSSTYKYSAVYQAFKVLGVGAKYKLTRIVFFLRRIGVINGHVVAKLYNLTGDRMSDATPTGSPLATSTPKVTSSLPTFPFEYGSSVSFLFDGSYQMPKDAEYCISMEIQDGSFDGGQCILVAKGSTMQNGVYGMYFSGAWHHE